MSKTYSLMIHGGAGELDHTRNDKDALPCLKSIRTILELGNKILKRNGSALDAVETCAAMLEDDPLFNAGRGSALNAKGKVEMDAAIMDGRDFSAGAVASVSGIVNPIKLARIVLAKSEHVMLVGEGAVQFARQHGIKTVPERHFITEHRRKQYEKLSAKGKKISGHKCPDEYVERHGTIGAVARDKKGNLAAATSTGGLFLKKWGRVGDSPIIGAGVYAENKTCAVSCTGVGEDFLRTVLAKHISDLIEYKKLNAAAAAKQGIKYLVRTINGHGGVIVIDKYGRCGSFFNTRTMIHGWIEHGDEIHCTI